MFDLTDVKTGAIEEGSYTLQVSKAEVKQTKAMNGSYIELEFNVISDNGSGAVLYDRFNVENANQKAVEIGLRQLKTFLVAAKGPVKFNDVQQLVGLTVNAYVVLVDNGFGERPEIKKYGPEGKTLTYHAKTKKVDAPNKIDASDVPF